MVDICAVIHCIGGVPLGFDLVLGEGGQNPSIIIMPLGKLPQTFRGEGRTPSGYSGGQCQVYGRRVATL